ncbi:hypothetical protein COU58_00900 [Candidatus Pacearchaeota archaeon CG10_big_fil_rev_8_21_14_0_10_32_42]|nr:MAG: hypothetical protein COU58_00900 [Candidatus Pacearchaeota archaeon CG10_big_fil_rev_8_21_14_0_10_32_42]
MRECYLCGILEDKSVLYKGIHKSRGIVNVCRKCFFKDRIPLIDKKEENFVKINERESVRERLSRMAHVNVKKREEKKIPYHFEDVHLKDIVEKNFKKDVVVTKNPPELIDNFHWVVMRKRRSLKLSKENLAESIKEPFIAIESLEKGILSKDYKLLIKKVEGFLGIILFKEKDLDHNDIITESKVPTGILIEDLKKKAEKDKESYIDVSNISLEKINEVYGIPKEQEKKEEKKEEKKGFSVKRFFQNSSDKQEEFRKKEEFKDKKDIGDEDISKLVWGR